MDISGNSYIYQHGTLGGLMQDLMEGTEHIGSLLGYGNMGIGTLAGSDGEVIFLDGSIYHVGQTGKVVRLTGAELTPYAAVTYFQAAQTKSLMAASGDQVKKTILSTISMNLFAAVKITGTFSSMSVRVAPKQEKPYPKFVDIVQHQPEFQAQNITGTIVGFFTPKLFHGAAAAGFHLHFLSESRTFAGHVLDFQLTKGQVELMEVAEFRQHFPIENRAYLQQEIDVETILKAIEVAE